jgi:hypothetical protein
MSKAIFPVTFPGKSAAPPSPVRSGAERPACGGTRAREEHRPYGPAPLDEEPGMTPTAHRLTCGGSRRTRFVAAPHCSDGTPPPALRSGEEAVGRP